MGWAHIDLGQQSDDDAQRNFVNVCHSDSSRVISHQLWQLCSRGEGGFPHELGACV